MKTRNIVGTLVVLVVLLAGAITVLSMRLANHNDPVATAAVAATPSSTFENGLKNAPKTEAGARSAAQEGWTAYGSGDYAGAWDHFTAKDKQLISRADYVRVVTECLGSDGPNLLNIHVRSARPEGNGYVVIIDGGIATTARMYVYENGQWKEQMSAQTKKGLENGPDAWLESLQAAGTCEN